MSGTQTVTDRHPSPGTQSPPKPSRRSTLAYLVLLQFFYAWAWNSGDVFRPAFRVALGLTLTQVGAGYSAQVFGALAGAMAIVRFEHAIGRRHAVTLTTLGIGASLLAGDMVTNWPSFLADRFALGFFGGAVFPLTIGLIADLFRPGVRGRLASVIDGTYFGAVAVLGLAVGRVGMGNWRTLLWVGGVPPVLFALAAYRCLSDHPAHAPDAPQPRSSIRALFAHELRARTLALLAMMGCNAFGSQAFSGWLTTYLFDVVRLDPHRAGAIVACQFVGSVVGCGAWGWVIDRLGRRAGAFGLLASAVAVAAFLLGPPVPLFLAASAATFGFAFSAVVTLGPWLAELYPSPLRTAGTSMFQWGRFISLLAPVLTGSLATYFGLRAAMGVATIALAGGALIWLRVPETLARDQAAKRSKA